MQEGISPLLCVVLSLSMQAFCRPPYVTATRASEETAPSPTALIGEGTADDGTEAPAGFVLEPVEKVDWS